MHKRKKTKNNAQVSLIAIVGLLLFIAAIGGVIIYNRIKAAQVEEEAKKTADTSLQADEIQKFVNDCIRKATLEGLNRLGQTGGYIEVPKLIDFKGTAMWQIDQANIQPFLNQTQQRLVEYINTNAPKCVESGNLSKFGFSIEKKELKTHMEFGNSDVTVKVIYPITLTKEKFSKEFSEFFNTFDIRYRTTFEAASEVNKRLFDADFDVKNPLKKMGYIENLNFDINYKTHENDMMTFTVVDRKSITPTNEFYAFNFVAKLGKSSLKRATYLQKNSTVNPTFLPFTIYSTDKKAQLDISEGTTINLNGQSVPEITVQQSYPKEVVTKDVPIFKENDQVLQKQDIKYIIDNPVYSFEPSGLLFNKFEKLTIYYDRGLDDSKGVGILIGKEGFWVPIPSKHEPEQKRVYSNIQGFTEFTAVNCGSQPLKYTSAKQSIKGNVGCFISWALTPVTFGFSIWVRIGYTFVTTALNAANVFQSKSSHNCETFYTTCDQNIDIQKQEKDGKGRCSPENNARIAAGRAVTVCAQVKKCNFLTKFLCKSCSVTCTASYY